MRTFTARLALCSALAASLPASGADETIITSQVQRAIGAEDWKQVSALLADAAKDPNNEHANYWTGMASFHQGDHATAAPHLAAALKANPLSREAAVALARCATVLCRTDRVKFSIMDGAIEAFPADVETLHLAGRARMARYVFSVETARDPGGEQHKDEADYLKTALGFFELSETLRGEYPQNDRWLAFALMRSGQHERAAEAAQRAINAGPAGWELHVTLGTCLTHLGRFGEAELAYRQARQPAPARAQHLDFERGKALYAMGRYNEAVEAFTAVLNADKGYAYGRHWLGRAALGARNYGLAWWAFGESRMLDELTEDLYWAGRCAYEIGDYPTAEKLFSQARQQFKEQTQDYEKRKGREYPPPPEWLHYLGRAQWGQDKRVDAIGNLKAAFAASARNLVFADWLLRAYIAENDLYKAVQVCKRLGTSGQDQAGLAYLKAILSKWPQPRLEDLRAKHYPHDKPAYEAMAEIHYAKGRYYTAARCYEQAGFTRAPQLSTHVGWAYCFTGRMAEAERVFRDYLQSSEVWRFYDESVIRHKLTDGERDGATLGLACALAGGAKWDESAATFGKIKAPAWDRIRGTGMLWARLASNGPDARPLADPYTVLGLIDSGLLGEDWGVGVCFLLPGSLLAEATPRLRAGDVVLSVGDVSLGSLDQTKEFRKQPIPTAAQPALIRRGTRVFEVTVDYPAALARLAKLPATLPTFRPESHPATAEDTP